MEAGSATPTAARLATAVGRVTDTPAARVTPPTGTPRPSASATPARTPTPAPSPRSRSLLEQIRSATATPAGSLDPSTRDDAATARAIEAAKAGGTPLLTKALSGELAHQPGAKKVSWVRPDLDTADFIAEVEFGNPYGSTEGTWDYGIFFRIDDAAKTHYRFVIKSTGVWELRYIENNNFNGPVAASGNVSNLATGRGASNKLVLVAYGDQGTFLVNGVWGGALWDLSDLTTSGDVAIMTGMFDDDHKAGASTKYRGFQVWEVAR